MRTFSERLRGAEERLKWSVLFAVLLAVLTSLRDVTSMDYDDWLLEFLKVLAPQITLFLYWGFAAPSILGLLEAAKRRQWSLPRQVAIYLAVFAAIGPAFVLYVAWINLRVWPFYYKGTLAEFLQMQNFTLILLNTAIKYFLPLLLAGALFLYYRGMREEENKAALLKQQLSDSQLRLLKMQLHPHFLFNSLHSISSLLHTDPETADRMISELSELLRMSLESSEALTVPLQEELRYLSKYLNIEQMRFSDRLHQRFSIEPGALTFDVPNLILQPLVENAIKHGISGNPGQGIIQIDATLQPGGLLLSVQDNGRGLASNGAGRGIGIANVRRRLEQLYGPEAWLDLKDVEPCGVRQELFIPATSNSTALTDAVAPAGS